MPGRSVVSFCTALCFVAGLGHGANPAHVISRWISPALRDYDAKAAAMTGELARLPDEPDDQSTERIGWHSRLTRDANSAKSITVDLGSAMDFDSVVLVPVNAAKPGYGFPIRFRVEALDEGAGLPVTLADATGADFAPPGNLPVIIDAPHVRARYVRVTATRLFTQDGFALFALGELIVLEGQRNLAAGAKVIGSDNYANAPAWDAANATDGQSVLGPPIHVEPSPGYGYHGQIAREETTTKWVQLDLGSVQPIDEVRLYAARPKDFPPRRGFGFPLRFRVETDVSDDFSQPKILSAWTEDDFPNPGENPVFISSHHVTARYVRVTATRLWKRDQDFIFALGEMQVFAGGENIAAGAKVTAHDNLEVGGWSARWMNDGFTSQGRLLNLGDWLHGLSRRREVLRELAGLESTRPRLVADAWLRGAMLAAGGVAAAGLVGMTLLLRRRRRHRQELATLRQRIAADLHDEIGSNLGSIALLARLAADQRSTDTRADLADIHRIAQETADSMRDIVWLIQPGSRDTSDLIARMREVAGSLLGDIDWKFEAGTVNRPFSLDFERQVFLLYKEALNNIRKHARARNVTISVGQQSGEFVLRITDDGAGFDPATATGGLGLSSMRHRAEVIAASLKWDSQPNHGTQLELRARLA
jgi:signal transduction histidine kinase